MREGHELIGWGMATSVYPTRRSEAKAVARLSKDGHALVEAATQDLGTGTYTIMTQIAADAIGLTPEQVTFRLGDSEYPETPVSGGSQTAASTGFGGPPGGASAAREDRAGRHHRLAFTGVGR